MTVIEIPDDQAAALKAKAAAQGLSLEEWFKRLAYEEAPADPNPAAVFDLGSSGGSDIAKNKDAMVAEAFASRRRKPRRR